MAEENTGAENLLDLPAEMFRSGDKDPEDFSILVWRVEEKNGQPQLIGDRLNKQFNDINGDAFFEGDIFVGKAATVRQAEKIEAKGIAILGEQFRWAGGRVKYLITDESLRHKIELAVKHWQDHSPFVFTEIAEDDITANTDFISFEDQGGCFSAVGRQGKKQ